MLNDVNRLQTVVIILFFIAVALLSAYWFGYTNGRDAQLLKQQRAALQVTEEVARATVVVQETMEKTDAKLERASRTSDDCNFVLNFDLTPCGVLD